MRAHLGQHFLRDLRVVKTIVAAAELKPEDRLLEIGPGKGVLTQELAGRAGRLVAVELDRTLAEGLERRFPGAQIIHQDFLTIDLDALFGHPRASNDASLKVLGNLPYAITSPIFEKLMPWPGWDLAVFLIQREVAERIQSPPGSRTFGILSLAVQLFAETEIITRVKPGAFVPAPRVHSCVIRLRRKTRPEVDAALVPHFFDLLHGAFAHRRKTLANSLALFTNKPRAVLDAWLAQHAIDPRARAETLGLAHYARLASAWAIFRREIDLT